MHICIKVIWLYGEKLQIYTVAIDSYASDKILELYHSSLPMPVYHKCHENFFELV